MAERIERGYINASGADLYPGRFVKFSDEGKVILCGLGELAIGVSEKNTMFTSSPTGSLDYVTPNGQVVPVVIAGIVEVVCGGNVSVGDFVTSDANGKAITANVNQCINGIALEAGEADSKIKILITHAVRGEITS